VALATVGLFVMATCKRVAALKQGVARASADSFATTTCRPLAGPVQTEPMRTTARANVGSFKILTSKPIAAPPPAGVAANADSFVVMICKPCAGRRPGEAQANVASSGTATCRRLAEHNSIERRRQTTCRFVYRVINSGNGNKKGRKYVQNCCIDDTCFDAYCGDW
jgi:hypothetical protein